MGKRGPTPTPKPVAVPKAQGSSTKRTPSSAFDGAAGNDTYEPEKVIALASSVEGHRYLAQMSSRYLAEVSFKTAR